MPYKIVYRRNTVSHLKEAMAWYKRQQNVLEKDFASSVKKAINRVQVHPEAFAVRYKNVRIAHTDRFPFSIHFYIDTPEKLIVIMNILHDRRHFESD